MDDEISSVRWKVYRILFQILDLRECKGKAYKTVEIIFLCNGVLSLYRTEPFACELLTITIVRAVITSVTIANAISLVMTAMPPVIQFLQNVGFGFPFSA